MHTASPRFLFCSLLAYWGSGSAHLLAATDSFAAVTSEIRDLSIDPSQTYRVRDLQISRGDIKIYLNEGTLAFAKPIAGRVVAAIFTTANAEVGDGEVLLMPPTRSERASLARFAKTPNLDEHISSAVFFFSDDTAQELRTQMEDHPLHPDPEQGKQIADTANRALRVDANQLDVRLAQSLLDNHTAKQGFFYGIIGGRSLGIFDVIYEPYIPESVLVGRLSPLEGNVQFFQIWCSFHPRRKTPPPDLTRNIADYQIDTFIHPDLSMTSEAKFLYKAGASDGRVISLELSSHLRVTSAQIDGKPAEFLQHETAVGTKPAQGASELILVAAQPLALESAHSVQISYEGSVVFRTPAGNYFVDERNTWYPFITPMLTSFDLTFHCPENLRVVATGELVSDEVAKGFRTVRRKTQVPESLAGFNIGAYETSNTEHGRYRIELFTNTLDETAAKLPAQAASILDYYSARWQPLDIHTLAVSPVEGYFGQGFPGLIYLSNISFIRQEDRPANLRNPRLDSFFTEMLLPHEIAHQWWGNMVSPFDYRSTWLFEAMSNYAALEFLEQSKGRAALDDVLESYRQDLLETVKGATVESAGPVDFGERLLDNDGPRAWHTIIYEKGAWIMHMLRLRLGDEAFHTLQSRLLSEYQNKLITNEDFRRVAASLVPEDQPDRSLNTFFENWVYATGIPRMTVRGSGGNTSLKVSGVDEGFSFDLPLRCNEQVMWVHAGAGENSFEIPNGERSCQLPKQTDYLYQVVPQPTLR